MKTSPCTPKRSGLFLISALIAAIPVIGQQSDDTDSSSEIIELSPFVVTAEEDSGYYASQTLAGTRLKTNVQDVGSSIQILTSEFLEDVGADDISDLFLYTTNTEAAGLNGNFSDYAVSDTSLVDGAFRDNPQNSQRVRGLAPADTTRSYFLSTIPSDGFNTERVEINRGANSILFGLGSPAGIANTTLNQARYSDFGEIKYRFDGEGSHRGELDYNIELVEDRLALRLGYLIDRTKYRQEPAFDNDDRFYLNLHAKPWKGAAIRGFYETGDRDANRPSLVFPASTIKFWFDAAPEVRGQIQDILDTNGVLDISGNPLTVPSDTVIAFDPYLYDIYSRNTNNMINATDVNRDGVVDGADDLARVHAIRNAVVWPSSNGDRYVKHPNASRQILQVYEYDQRSAGGAPGGVSALQSNLNSQQWLPKPSAVPPGTDPSGNNRFGGITYNSSIQPWRDRDPVQTPESIDNLDIFDFTENLISGDASFQNDDWDHYNIAFEQLLFEDHFGFEVVYDKQSYNRESFLPFQGFTGVFVDTMTSYLGQPNPNFGRPFAEAGGTNKIDVGDDRETLRVTSFYRFNPEEIWENSRFARWMGEHTLTGLYNTYDQNDTRAQYGQYWSEQYAGSTFRNNDTQLTDSNRIFKYMAYLSDQDLSQLGSYDEVRLNPMSNQQLWDPGQTTTFQDINPTTGELFTNTLTAESYMNRYVLNEQEVESLAAVWNGYFLDRHLVGLFGWRQDDAYAASYEGILDQDTGVSSSEDLLLIGGGDKVKVESISWSVVGHMPDRFLPKGTGLSVHYGFSENFTLGATSRDLYGNRVDAPSGETKEYGFTAKLFDGKLYARFNWYETSLLNRQLQGNANLYDTFINRMLLHTYANLKESEVKGFIAPSVDDETGAIDPGTPNFDLGMSALGQLTPLIPPSLIEEASLVGIDGTGSVATNRRNLEFGDTEDVTAEGFEIELTYNPTSSWRVSLNVAKQETVTSNYAPRLAALLELTNPILDSATGSIKDLRFYPSYDADPPIYMTGEFVDTNSVAELGERLVYSEYRNALAQQGKVSAEQRKWRVNLITNYNFRDGWLKGTGIGAALRWQDGAVIGYPTEIVDGQFISDIDNPHVAPSETTVDVWLRYRTKIFKGKIDWTIELRVQNINTDAHDLIPVAAKTTTDYDVAVWRSGPPRIWRISNSFKF